MEKEGVKNKIHVICDGVDYFRIQKIKSSKKNKKTLIAHAGGIDKHDGVLNLPNSAMKLEKDTVFLLIGDGADRKEIERLIKKFKVSDRFKITGWIKREKVIGLLKSSDIGLVCRTSLEGNQLVPTIKLFEYLATGLPVIAPNLKAIREIDPKGKIITFYEPENNKDMVNKINSLIRNKKKLKNLGKKSRELGKKYDWSRLSKKMADVILK